MGNVYVEHRAVVWVAEGHLTRSCAPMFKFSYRPQECFPRGKFLPKITIFGDYWCCTTTVLSYNVEISHDFGVSAGSKSNSMRFQHNSRSNTTIQDFPYVHGLIINWHIQDGNVWLLLSLISISEFLFNQRDSQLNSWVRLRYSGQPPTVLIFIPLYAAP